VKRKRTIRIGVIADTHGLFDPALIRHFRGVDHILHAGDIGQPSVIQELQSIAPVTAVSGNVDGYERSGYPSERIIKMAGRRVAIRHILYEGGKLTGEGRAFLERARPDICIFGHTHQPWIERFGHTLLFNPGSAGPRRFTLPRGIGILTIGKNQYVPTLIRLPSRVQMAVSREQQKEIRSKREKLRAKEAPCKNWLRKKWQMIYHATNIVQ